MHPLCHYLHSEDKEGGTGVLEIRHSRALVIVDPFMDLELSPPELVLSDRLSSLRSAFSHP